MKTLLSLSALCIALLSSGVHASERAETGWELIEKGALVVDVRTPAEFEQGHLNNPSTTLFLKWLLTSLR